jgi:membrane associated rhomboid family serine protease/DNA-directed RNA polymerase subunit RPC12/RpoP
MIVPWQVDVPQDRWPVMNWLIILATVGVYGLQVRDIIAYETPPDQHVRDNRPAEPGVRRPIVRPGAAAPPREMLPPGITGRWMLRGWHLKGLLGHMWLHGGLLHLIGNMWFLWIFGNAVCAKVGNLVYLPLYVLLGVTAGVAHLLTNVDPVLGASGAINGVVGMYLVLFYANDITCYFIFLPFIIRQFDVSSFWMILVWLFWDIVGAFGGGSRVAHFAHLGGFAMGFGIALVLCWKGWITMTWYEKSLVQAWQQRRADRKAAAVPAAEDLETPAASAPMPVLPSKPVPMLDLDSGKVESPPVDADIHVACSCGRKIRAPRRYAGKTVLCPRCRERILIPQTHVGEVQSQKRPPAVVPMSKASANGAIRFACQCGRKIRVSARYAGRFGKCPQCGARVKVPQTPRSAAGESA